MSACGRCNHAKADRVIAELGWRLHAVPKAPSGTAWRIVGSRRMEPSWQRYLDGGFGEASA